MLNIICEFRHHIMDSVKSDVYVVFINVLNELLFISVFI